MIKIKTNYDYERNVFCLKELKHKHSCTIEMLSLIHLLIEELSDKADIDKKTIYKILKDFDKEKIMEEINAH